ncbi:hypothetical protein ACOSP7_030408 [Xanthoceras sorbifolium]
MSFKANSSKSLSLSSSSSSSSNPEEELDLTALIEAQSQLAHAQHRAMLNVHANNNLLMVYYLNQQDSDQLSRGGSIPGHNVIHRRQKEAAHNLWAYYFAENPRYNELMFRRRFRMGRSLFLHIANEVEPVFRMLAYGVPADSTDEYIKIGESTSIESMKRFCRVVVEVFGERYLRSPNAYDVARNARESRLYALEMEKLSNGLGKEYSTRYYLADGIYPKWSTLVQIIHDPRGPQKKVICNETRSM